MPRIRRGFPVIRPGTARLHPKSTSSRFALRAPRRLAPHNDKSGVITVLTGACTSRQRCAGSGMPLPYNSGCGRRNCFKICNCQWRSLSAATVKSVSTHVRRCPAHLGRPLLRLPRRFAPRNDKSGVITVLTGPVRVGSGAPGAACRSPTIAGAVGGTASKFATANGAQGAPLQTQSVCTFCR